MVHRRRLALFKQLSLTTYMAVVSLLALCNVIGILLLQKNRMAVKTQDLLPVPSAENPKLRKKYISLSALLGKSYFFYNFSASKIDSIYGMYRKQSFFVKGDAWEESSKRAMVTLATQCSVERLETLLEVGDLWDGPLSIGVFVPGVEFQIAKLFISFLRNCSAAIRNNASFHIVFPHQRPPKEDASLTEVEWFECHRTKDFLRALLRHRTETFVAWRRKVLFPQNHLRNLARDNLGTPYHFVTDIDILPSPILSDQLPNFLRKVISEHSCPKCAFVVPTYEIPLSAPMPRTKPQLLGMVKEKQSRPFHHKVFSLNQYSTNHSRWEGLAPKDHLTLVYKVNYEFFYEPFYVADRTIPRYDERFIGYGFTRNTQVYEAHLAGFQFWVLDPGFAVHRGMEPRRGRASWREKQNLSNGRRFLRFKSEVLAKYGVSPTLAETTSKGREPR